MFIENPKIFRLLRTHANRKPYIQVSTTFPIYLNTNIEIINIRKR